MHTSVVRRGLWLSAFLSLLAVLAGCGPKVQPVDPGPIGLAVDSLVNHYNTAVAARDTGALVDLYTDDARLLPAGDLKIAGKDAIHGAIASILSTPGLQLTYRSNEKLVSDRGDMVVDLGTYEWQSRTPMGKEVRDVGKYVRVYRKVDGRWKLSVETFNSDGAAAAVAKP